MPELTNGTWIVVADSEKALLMRNLTDNEDPNFQVIAREDQPEVSDNADRPGRLSGAAGTQISAMEQSDWHVLARDKFAKELAEILYRHAHKGAFEQLVIAAEPQVLGKLRDELHTEVKGKVVAEIPKNMANHTIRDLERLIKADLDAM